MDIYVLQHNYCKYPNLSKLLNKRKNSPVHLTFLNCYWYNNRTDQLTSENWFQVEKYLLRKPLQSMTSISEK